MATSDLPGGVVNVLTGSVAEIAPWLASHLDVNGIDLTGVTDADAGARRWRCPPPRTSSGSAGPGSRTCWRRRRWTG